MPPLTTLRTWASKVHEGEPLEGYNTNSVLSRTKEETILKFTKELKYAGGHMHMGAEIVAVPLRL